MCTLVPITPQPRSPTYYPEEIIMVEIGVTYNAVVNTFDRKRHVGSLIVLNADGQPTEEVESFHFNDGVYPRYSLMQSVDFTVDREHDCQRLRFPAPGDQVTFRKVHDEPENLAWTRNQWTYTVLWDEEARKLLMPHEWRLIRRYGLYSDGSFPDFELVRKDILATGRETLDAIHGFDTELFLPYKADTDQAEAAIDPHGVFIYQLDVRTLDGDWKHLRTMRPNGLVKVVG